LKDYHILSLMAKPSIIGHLETELKRTLRDSTITVGEIENKTGLYSITSCQGNKYLHDDETNHNLVLFPFRVAETFDYWLSFTLEYNIWEKKVLHISIAYFDADLCKIFRAEWANNSLIEHAQPHWHIHNRKPDLESPLWDENAIKIFPAEVEEMVNDKIKNIHFAMSSTWHENLKHAKNISDSHDRELLNWVNGVLIYVTHQLTYLHDKSKV